MARFVVIYEIGRQVQKQTMHAETSERAAALVKSIIRADRILAVVENVSADAITIPNNPPHERRMPWFA